MLRFCPYCRRAIAAAGLCIICGAILQSAKADAQDHPFTIPGEPHLEETQEPPQPSQQMVLDINVAGRLPVTEWSLPLRRPYDPSLYKPPRAAFLALYGH
jgi:hypothetical protein